MKRMNPTEIAVKLAVENTLRKVLAAAKEATDKEAIIKRIEAMIGDEG